MVVNSTEENRRLLVSLINAIEAALLGEDGQFGKFHSTFLDYDPTQDPRLEAPEKSWSSELRALWYFADIYFFSYSHGDPDVDRISWEHALYLLRTSIESVRNGEGIKEPEVLRYDRP